MPVSNTYDSNNVNCEKLPIRQFEIVVHSAVSRDEFDKFQDAGDAKKSENLDNANDAGVVVGRTAPTIVDAVLDVKF